MAKMTSSIDVRIQLDKMNPRMSYIVYEILAELNRSHDQHGDFPTMRHGYAVLEEEVDEAWDEIKRDNKQLALEEMVQVAAMAIKFIDAFAPNAEEYFRKLREGTMTVGEAKEEMGHSDDRPAAVTGELGDDANH